MAPRAPSPKRDETPAGTGSAGGYAPPPSQPGTLKIRTFAYEQPGGEQILTDGQQLLRSASVVVRGPSNEAVEGDPSRDPEDMPLWSLEARTYFIQPQPLAGYTTPTQYYTFEAVKPAFRNFDEPVEINPGTSTEVYVGYCLEAPEPSAVVQAPILDIDAARAALERYVELATRVLQQPYPKLQQSPIGTASINVEPSLCTGGLKVTVFEAPDTDQPTDCSPDYPPVGDAPVTITAVDTTAPFCDTRLSVDAIWDDLPPGRYRVAIGPLRGYLPPSGYVVNSKTAPKSEGDVFEVVQEKVTSVCVGVRVIPAYVCVSAVYDEDRCGNSAGHPPLAQVQVDIWRGNKRLGCIQTVETQDCTSENWLAIEPGQ